MSAGPGDRRQTARRRRTWPAHAGLVALRLGSALPWALHPAAGAALGELLLRVLRRRRAVAADNLARCFPELDAPARAGLLRAHFHALGRGLLGLGLSWWAPDRRLQGLADVHGLAHLDAAVEGGHGVLLLSGHFTDLELGGRLLALHRPFHVVYRRHENPVIQEAMRRQRTLRFARAIPREDMRGLLRSLREGHVVWYAPDQHYSGPGSVVVPFFGQPAATTNATARIAARSGAPVVPFSPRRTADGRRLELLIEPPLADFPSGDHETDAACVYAVIERHARRAPEQYWWVHRRFKAGRAPRPGARA